MPEAKVIEANAIKVSVIVGTYNYLPSLQLTLRSLERQRFSEFEVIIADDGSRAEVGEWLRGYTAPFPVKHLWQEDLGFRKCRVLNRAVAKSASDYLVFIDADCLIARDFLQVHWENRVPRRYLGARRVMMSQDLSEGVTAEMVDDGRFDSATLWGLWHSIRGRMRYYEETFRTLHRLRGEKPFSLLGCNFSIHKEDLLAVNGFDEEYETRGGGEDTDIALRLSKAGITMKSVRYLALQFHLGHEKGETKDASERLFKKKRIAIKTADDAAEIKSSLRESSTDNGNAGDRDKGDER